MKKILLSLFFVMMFMGGFQLHAGHQKVVSTNVIAYQYTTDGWMQHVAVYEDSVICTNIEGPREGVQFIIMNNGALADMCNSYKQHKDRFTHKYSWGEVNTYREYQTVSFK